MRPQGPPQNILWTKPQRFFLSGHHFARHCDPGRGGLKIPWVKNPNFFIANPAPVRKIQNFSSPGSSSPHISPPRQGLLWTINRIEVLVLQPKAVTAKRGRPGRVGGLQDGPKVLRPKDHWRDITG